MERRLDVVLVGGSGVILLIALLAYVPAMRAGFIWDDDAYVTENATLKNAAGLWQIWFEPGATPQYYPLVFSTFWIEYRLWALNPLGYHMVNILLHGLGAVLAWFVLRRLTVPGAWLAAALFAVHPVHVESVAWITERKNVLSGVFYLSAALAYFRFCSLGKDHSSSQSNRSWCFYACSLGLFVCALLSKTVTCSLPAAILLMLWWKRDRLARRDMMPLIPMAMAGAVMGVITAWVERKMVGAEGAEWSWTLAERCVLAGRVVWFYLAKLLWPTNLIFIYPRWSIDASHGWSFAFSAACVVVLILLWIVRHRIGKGPLVGALFYVGTLGPALGFFPVYFMRYAFVADHFQYLASLGPLAIVAALLVRLAGLRRVPPTNIRQAAGCALSVIALSVLATATWHQSRVYANSESLWTDTLRKNPSAWMTHNNLGQLRWNQKRYQEAERHFAEYVRLRPNDAQAHNHLANALARKNDLQGAAAQYEEALRLDPNLGSAHLNLGTIRDLQGRVPEAINCYSAAIKLNPNHTQALVNLAKLLHRAAVTHLREGRPEKAMAAATLARQLAGRTGDVQLIGRIDACIQICRRYQATRPALETGTSRAP